MNFELPMIPRFFGARVPRTEDKRLLTGGGRYVDDIPCPDVLHAAFLRSPYAHARIVSVDLSGCAGAGAIASFHAEDLGPVSKPFPIQLPNPAIRGHSWAALAKDKVRFYGEPVAVVVAASRAEAEDALEAARVEYEVLPAASHPVQALEPGAPLVQDELGDNLAAHLEGKIGDVDQALSGAAHVETFEPRIQRGAAGAMECRAILAQYEGQFDRLRIYASTQAPHTFRQRVAMLLGRPEDSVEVIAPDVGGGFGPKGSFYPENLVVPWLAVRLGRSVKWTEDRLEFIQAGIQEREGVHEVTVGFDDEGKILALKIRSVVDTGAYPVYGVLTQMNMITHAPCLYKLRHYSMEMDVVYTNRVPCGPVRGAGRPQGTFLIERTMDRIAYALGLDGAQVRFRNLVQPEEMPYVVGLPTWGGPMTYDSGDYPELLRRTLEKADYDSLRNQERRTEGGRLIGVGVACNIEMTGSGPFEGARIRVEPSGKVAVATGASPQGQGHVTTFTQVAADAMSVSPEDVKVITGDTTHISYGIGTFGSRSAVNATSAILLAARSIREKALSLAAERLEAGREDLTMEEGKVFVKGAPERSIGLGELARFSMVGAPGKSLPPGTKPGLESEEYFRPPAPAFAYGAHVAVVEVDPETGFVKVLRYVAGHDCGKIINPLLVDGQVHGGVAHGIGDALIEELAFDENGTPLASTFLDYLLPLSTDIPPMETVHLESPCPNNPAGVKGAGEGGTIGSIAAVVSAIEDALKPLGIRIQESPVTPARLHALIQEQSQRAGA
ncbi:MAG: molybdopterin cofactor-binding domain-containing protein [Nitrospinota bacterium]